MDPMMNNIPRLYQVNVVLLEARHLDIESTNTKVIVSIEKKKKTIRAKSNKTDSPYFNDFCVFVFRLPLNILLDKVLKIQVYDKKITKRLVGSINLDLATVWSQPNHQFYHKWAVLLNPKNVSSGIRGFLKCDIAILTKGIVVKPPSDAEDNDELERNLLVPYREISDRQRTRVVFTVFRADPDVGKIGLYKPYIKITYGGNVGKTRVAKSGRHPVWNQELAFLDLFPPLTQNIFIELFDKRIPRRRSIGNTKIEINTLYEKGENGFLPTFGPNFVYLYHPFKKFEHHRNGSTYQNSFTYTARVLLALRTEILEYNNDIRRRKKFKVIPKIIPPLNETNYFDYKKFILFATIFDTLIFDNNLAEAYVKIQVRLGPKSSTKIETKKKKKSKGKEQELKVIEPEDPNKLKHTEVINECNTTPLQKTTVMGNYRLTSFPGQFPCVCVIGHWPDFLSRMYRANVIKKVIQDCNNDIKEIKNDLQFKTEKLSKSVEKLKTTLENLSKSCEDILQLTKAAKKESTNLARHRQMVYRQELKEIASKAKLASTQQVLKAEDELSKISNYLSRLTKYSQDPENSVPDTEVWILRRNQTLVQQRIKTEDVVFSEDIQSRGIMSGKTQSLLFRGRKGNLKVKMDIFLWFGLADQFEECLKLLPNGLNQNNKICLADSELKIPLVLISDEKHDFQLRAHIFQGKILFGFDNTGLTDPYVQVIILDKMKATQVRKSTLSPVWNETLVLPNITLYGPSSYIKENQTSITVELFDQEKAGKPELIGRCFVKPLIKLKDEKYIPPKLTWESIVSKVDVVAELLITTELLEVSPSLTDLFPDNSSPLQIPENIRPEKGKYRMEVFFWGIRRVTKKRLKKKMFVLMECNEQLVKSSILNLKHKLNFNDDIKFVDLTLPEEPEYAPPFSLKLYRSGVLHKENYVGTCLIPSVRHFLLNFMTTQEMKKEKLVWFFNRSKEKEKERKEEETKKLKRKEALKKLKSRDFWDTVLFPVAKFYRYCICKLFKKCEASAYELAPKEEEEKEDDEEKLNWWVKFHTSDENLSDYSSGLKIYHQELEDQPEFEKFQDFTRSFDMITGHEGKRTVVRAKVKAAIAIYKWPPENGEIKIFNNLKEGEGILSHVSNNPVNVLIRVYVIRAINLTGKDANGSSDPYLHIQLGSHRINDRKNYKTKQQNPTFGKCYEFQGIFPQDYLLRIKVLEHDVHSKDDLIGETLIDVENRFYSKHHATCGIARTFKTKGHNFWRDIHPPTEILSRLCEASSLKPPIYYKNKVVIEDQEFETKAEESEDKADIQALEVLHRWQEIPFLGFHLVPEHIETRSLYHPAYPGIEQGKLQLWVDIFPANVMFIPPQVNIEPQPPVAMELRAIVWNVVDVVLDDKLTVLNGRVSDIYLKGWILSLEEETQKTDIHYKSLNGEGNFNWRFIFHFNYIPLERKLVVKKQKSAFDKHPEEQKVHCKLEIQVWDNDVFGDDYLGTLILELSSMPRGAKIASRCTLKMLAPNSGRINLFKIKKTRGWWPFKKVKGNLDRDYELTGKIDLELEILTAAEAKMSPAGLGRAEPDALPAPNRPDTSFNWVLNPIKTFRYVLWRRILGGLVIAVVAVLFGFFILIGLYSFPNYVVKRLVGA